MHADIGSSQWGPSGLHESAINFLSIWLSGGQWNIRADASRTLAGSCGPFLRRMALPCWRIADSQVHIWFDWQTHKPRATAVWANIFKVAFQDVQHLPTNLAVQTPWQILLIQNLRGAPSETKPPT